MSQRMQKTPKLLLKYGFLYCVGGSIYYGIEILWRGFSHWTMFYLAGMCFIFAGLLNEIESWEHRSGGRFCKLGLLRSPGNSSVAASSTSGLDGTSGTTPGFRSICWGRSACHMRCSGFRW